MSTIDYKALAERLRELECAVSNALPGSYYMDPPDGGDVPLGEQVRRMALDARRYRWIAGHCRSTSEHWGGRWSIVVEGPCPAKHDEEGAFDDAIDAAMDLTRPAEES